MSPSLVFVELERVERLEEGEGHGGGGAYCLHPEVVTLKKAWGQKILKLICFSKILSVENSKQSSHLSGPFSLTEVLTKIKFFKKVTFSSSKMKR
jgi:hypothetical protein